MVPIDLQNLAKTYKVGFWARKVVALRGISFKVGEGQVFGLLGPNGAGKSTTIKSLLNLIRPSAGTITVMGRPHHQVEARESIGYLPENPAPYEYLSGREFVTLGAQLSRVPSAELRRRVDETIERVGLGGSARLQIRRYSKGMVQRIALAWAIVGRPKLLVLDEPTSGLDVLGRQLIRELIVEEKARGSTVVFCSHIIPDVEQLCERVALLVRGELVKEGTVSELLGSTVSETEATVEGLGDTDFGPLRVSARVAGSRTSLKFEPSITRSVLEAVWAKGGQLVQLQPSRFTLEELFLRTVKDHTSKASGEMSP
jgi:ABC-2 type transport system ATP-binding protein